MPRRRRRQGVHVSYRISKGLKSLIDDASELTGQSRTYLFKSAMRSFLDSDEFEEMREQIEDEKRSAQAFERERETGTVIHTFDDRDEKLNKIDTSVERGNLTPEEGPFAKLEIIDNYATTKKIAMKNVKKRYDEELRQKYKIKKPRQYTKMTDKEVRGEVFRLMRRIFPSCNKNKIKRLVKNSDIRRARDTESGILDIVFNLKKKYDND